MPDRGEEYLGTWSIGDKFPCPYFVLYEKTFNTETKSFNELDLDPSSYSHIKFCARHENNNQDVNDHTKDDIYADLTNVNTNVFKYSWGVNDIAKAGRYNVRIEYQRTTGEKYHAPYYFYFIAENKMPGKFGNL